MYSVRLLSGLRMALLWVSECVCMCTVWHKDTCIFSSFTADSDYTALNRVCTLTSTNSMCDFHLEIIDDFTAELDESFNVILESSDPRCAIVDNNITFYIIDDGQ